jgi:hypothetical protein
MRTLRFLAPLYLLVSLSAASAAENPFLGRWALTIPGGRAGWLGVEEKGGSLTSSVLWGGGSVVPTKGTMLQGDTLIVTRESRQKRKGKDGKQISEKVVETIRARVSGDQLSLTVEKQKENGKPFGQAEFGGKRIPDLPPTPDLSKVTYGEPVSLLNGTDLTGWRLVNPESDNGWSVQDGILVNRVKKEDGKHFGNLRTDAEFEDFNLTLEVRTMEKSNSGVYLRGIYEVQVMETFGRPVDSHHMGALYSRVTPRVAAEKPIGEWQTLDITLVDRHLTVILNGQTIIDNHPVLGCTGGALTSDEFQPGPILLQGDHTDIDYRNLVLRPVVK